MQTTRFSSLLSMGQLGLRRAKITPSIHNSTSTRPTQRILVRIHKNYLQQFPPACPTINADSSARPGLDKRSEGGGTRQDEGQNCEAGGEQWRTAPQGVLVGGASKDRFQVGPAVRASSFNLLPCFKRTS